MISEFLCAASGRLSYYNREKGKRDYATEFIQYGSGKGDDGWWNAEKMVQQTRKAIEVFNKAFLTISLISHSIIPVATHARPPMPSLPRV
jgi:hypothetical protein